MILFVCTGPTPNILAAPEGTSVLELDMVEREAVEAEEKVVEGADICDDLALELEVWLMV